VIYTGAFAVLWVSWGLYLWLQSRGTKTNVWRESLGSRLLHIVPLMVAGLLLVVRTDAVPGLVRRFVPVIWIGLSAWILRSLGATTFVVNSFSVCIILTGIMPLLGVLAGWAFAGFRLASSHGPWRADENL
jgi:hypothetical protein